VIAYCGGGISATIDRSAASARLRNLTLYDGSMGEWQRMLAAIEPGLASWLGGRRRMRHSHAGTLGSERSRSREFGPVDQ